MFDAQAAVAAAEGKYPPFAFRGLDGTEYSLPNMQTLTERHGSMIAGDRIKDVVRELDEKAFDAIDAMPMYVAADLVAAWVEQAGDEGKAESPPSQTQDGDEH